MADLTREQIEALKARLPSWPFADEKEVSFMSAICSLALVGLAVQPRPELVLAYCDDWQGLYVDGNLKTQGHSVRADDVAEALGLTFTLREVPQKWAEERGDFPKALTSLPEPRT